MRVRWLRKALRDLDEDARYIATDDDGAAGIVVERVTWSRRDARDPARARAERRVSA